MFSFSDWTVNHPSEPIPGDRVDSQFDNHARAIETLRAAVEKLLRADGKLNHDCLSLDSIPSTLLDSLVAKTQRHADLLIEAANAALAGQKREADALRALALSLKAELDETKARAKQAERALTESQRIQQTFDTKANAAMREIARALDANADAFNDVNWAVLQANTAEDWALVSTVWAEYMDGNAAIPSNILASNAITGDHWSSRWWANRSANAFGMLAWWYMGAWPGPPPTTPLTPTGQPIPDGGMYFDTDLGMMLVWNGSSWVPLAQGAAAATTATLYYHAAAGQTLFPLSVADRYGHTFAFNQTATEGLLGLVNGVRLEPTVDFTVDTVASSVAFLRPLSAGAVVAFDLLTPVSQLSPSGSVNTVLLSPLVPDGVKTVFNLFVASSGSPVNVAKNEELLVSVDGVQQSPGAAYNASAGSITFVEAPRADALIFIVWFGPAVAGFSAPAPASLWSADDAAANAMTLSNGGLTVTPIMNAWQSIRGTISKTSGKLYVEFKPEVVSGDFQVGVANAGFSPTAWLGNNPQSASVSSNGIGTDYSAGAFTSNYNALISNDRPINSVVSLAIDFSTGGIWAAQDNIWLNSSNPATNSLPIYTFVPATVGALFPAVGFNAAASGVWTLQSTAASQKYAPPSGFKAWDAP